MACSRQPWFKFHPADWRGDAGLRSCSLAARGLWADCLGIMHEADPRGYLVLAGEPVDLDRLALLVSRPLKEVRGALAELERARVPSRTEAGVIYSRKMVRDTERAASASANGRRGGNPALIGQGASEVNGSVNGSHNQILNPACARTRDLGSEFSIAATDAQPEGEPERAPASPPIALVVARFETFWDAYPHKVGKQDAEKAFAKLKPDHALLAVMLDALARQKASPTWPRELRFVMHPSKWLNGKRWQDEIAAAKAPAREHVAAAWHRNCPHEPKCLILTKCDDAWAVEKARLLDSEVSA